MKFDTGNENRLASIRETEMVHRKTTGTLREVLVQG